MTVAPPLESVAFGELHRLLSERQSPAPAHRAERRRERRHAFCRLQLMAPLEGERLPDSSSFRQVQCHDLSARGFSYLSQEPPTFQYLIVALGGIPFKFFLAEVRHVRLLPPSQEAAQHLIGCRFIRRVGTEPDPSATAI